MKRYTEQSPEQMSICPIEFRVQNRGRWKHFGSQTTKTSEPHLFGILWMLHQMGLIDEVIVHQRLISPPVPLLLGDPAVVFVPRGWIPWQPAPINSCYLQIPHHTTKVTLTFLIPGNAKGFRSSWPEMGQRENICFL